jgi:hypothetical protein
MPTGVFPAGLGPAGADPVQTGVTLPRKLPKAIRYEGATRDFPLDAMGHYQAVTPVEQGFALGLCVKQGDIKSSPTTGNTLHEIVYVGDPDLDADVRDRIVNANPIKRYLDEGQAEIVRIDVQVTPNGFLAAVYFRDLTGDKNKTLRRDAFIRR